MDQKKFGRFLRRHRRKWIAAAVIAAVLILAALILYRFPIYRIVEVWQPGFYDAGEVSALADMGSREDRRIAGTVMARAELAFADVGLGREEAEEQYGLLSRYVINGDSYPEAVSERHTLKLWSAHFQERTGVMWVWYSQEGLDADGDTVTGSWDIPALWYLEKSDGGDWEVTRIKEHP